MTHTLLLDANDASLDIVGGKGESLAMLINAGFLAVREFGPVVRLPMVAEGAACR